MIMDQEDKEKYLAVVKVESGIPTSVEIFGDIYTARRRERYIRKNTHPENDETGLFEVSIKSKKSSS